MGESAKRAIGLILLDGGFLTYHDLTRALQEQKQTKELLGQVLIRKGTITPDEINVPLLIQDSLGDIEHAVTIAAGDRQTLGALLVQSQQITSEQLDQVLAEQQRSGEKIGEICTRIGLLTVRQLNALLDFQHNQEIPHASPLRLGELLVATGRLSRGHLEDALYKQSQFRKKLGEILVDAGYARPAGIEYCANLQKRLLKSVLVAILALGVSTAGQLEEGLAYAETNATCTFSKQLLSSPQREQFVADVSAVGNTLWAYNTINEDHVQSDESGYFSFTELPAGKQRSTYNQGETLDQFSRNCLTCHDGGHASEIHIDYRNAPGNKVVSFDGTKQHPIGMDYAAYVDKGLKSYNPVSTFNSKMIFVDGRVGCLTCHNPLNQDKSHLVMSDYRSALCLTCHKK